MEAEELHAKLYPEAVGKPEYILCAAIHYTNGLKYDYQPKNIESGYVACGRRHHNIISLMGQFGRLTKRDHIDGFLTSKDRFVDRKEAAAIAYKAGQISKPNNCLFSEDLY